MNIRCLKSSKRGVASIIGGVFLILIILSGYAFYVLSNSATNDLQSTLQKRSTFDNEKNQEILTINNCLSDPEHTGYIIDVTNSGTNTIRLRYIGAIKNNEPDTYPQYNFVDLKELAKDNTQINEFIEPGQTRLYLIPLASFNENGDYLIKVISEKGSVFTVIYRHSVIRMLPIITLSSPSGVVGEKIIVSGYNFPYRDITGITLKIGIEVGSQVLETIPPDPEIKTNENGSFSATFIVPAMGDPLPHKYTIFAEYYDTTKPSPQAPFTINP